MIVKAYLAWYCKSKCRQYYDLSKDTSSINRYVSISLIPICQQFAFPAI